MDDEEFATGVGFFVVAIAYLSLLALPAIVLVLALWALGVL